MPHDTMFGGIDGHHADDVLRVHRRRAASVRCRMRASLLIAPRVSRNVKKSSASISDRCASATASRPRHAMNPSGRRTTAPSRSTPYAVDHPHQATSSGMKRLIVRAAFSNDRMASMRGQYSSEVRV